MQAQYFTRGCLFARKKSLDVDVNATTTRNKKFVFDLFLKRLLSPLEAFAAVKLRPQCTK